MKPYRTNIRDVPLVGGLSRDEGWIDMQVQFLIDERSAGTSRLVVGRTVIPPGGRHERHRHPNADEFLVVLAGSGHVYTDEETAPAAAGDVIFTPAGHWHGFVNTSGEDALLLWGWSGAGSLEAAGYELPEESKSRLADDPRVVRGMRTQLQRRRERLESGERPLGWKVGFGSPTAMEQLGIDAPLVGFLTRQALVASGADVSIGDWTKPAAEPEIAVYLGSDVPGGSSREAVRQAIASVGPAIELADVDTAADDVEGILSTNVFQRAVVLGPRSATRTEAPFEGLRGHVFRDGQEVAGTDDPQRLTGELVDVVRNVADLLAAFDEQLRAGDLIITGSIVPPLWVEASEDVRFELDPVGAVEVRLVR